MDADADSLLLQYFATNLNDIENWFNIISPKDKTIDELKAELAKLKAKNWNKIL